jgi:DNA-binding transcriptional regulator YhcF (GntR family)
MANTAAAQKADQQKRLRINEEKWTKTLMDAGWTALPSIILDKQHALGIEPLDLNILLQLAKHWWKRDDLPYPSKDTLAKTIGVNPSTIRKRIARMESEGLIQRLDRHDAKGGQQSNHYSFAGLIEKMLPHAQEAIALKAKQKGEKETFLKKKKAAAPKLHLVTPGGKTK